MSFSPLSIGGCKLALLSGVGCYSDAGVTPATNGGTVRQWSDQSGQGNHATQATAGSRPVLRSTGLNNQPSLQFDGVDDSLSMPRVAGLTAATVYVVATIAGAQYSVFGTQPAGLDPYWRWSGDGNGYIAVLRSPRVETYPAAMPTTGSWLFCVRSGASYEVLMNAASKGVQSGAFSAGNASWVIGNEIDGGKPLNGHVAELWLFDSVLTGAKHNNVTKYLNRKFGLFAGSTAFRPALRSPLG